MTRHGKQYGAIALVLVGLVALPGGGQAAGTGDHGQRRGANGAGAGGEFTMGATRLWRKSPCIRYPSMPTT